MLLSVLACAVAVPPVTPTDPVTAAMPAGFQREGPAIPADLLERGRTDQVMLLRSDKEPEQLVLAVFVQDLAAPTYTVVHTGDLTTETLRYPEQPALQVTNRVITFHHQSMRNHQDIKFRYEPKLKDFAVIGLDQVYYGLTSDTISVNYLTGNRITTPNGTGEAVSMRFEVDPLPRLTDYHAEWNDPSIDPARKR